MQLEERFNKEVYILKQRKSQEDMPHFPIGTVRLVKVKKKKLIGKNIGILDIFVKRRVGDKYFWIVGQTGNVLKSVAYHYYEKLGRYPFDGYEYSVPAEYEDYLTCRYGDWRKTVKDYNFKKDDQSIVNA
jgi:phosphorylcholine metabolism protein LicD